MTFSANKPMFAFMLATVLAFPAAADSASPTNGVKAVDVNAKPTPELPAAKPIAAAKPEAVKPVVAAKPEAAKPVVAAKPDVEEVDEIDLEEMDDSAAAAKVRPVVKLAPEAKPVKAPSAAVPVAAPAPSPVPAAGLAPAASKLYSQDDTALVNITSDDATLSDILRQFRKATGANIIYPESSNLQQRVSVSLQRVPWLQAMSSILVTRGFRVESTDGIHYVKEDRTADPKFTRTFVLHHASAMELAELFNTSYGERGRDGRVTETVATPFQGANVIVVRATDRVLSDCEKIVRAIDKAIPQIYIEARFIELSNEALHKLGVQWNQLQSWGAKVHDLNGGMSYGNDRARSVGLSWDKGLTVNNASTSSEGVDKSSGANNSALSSSASSSYADSANSSSSSSRNSNRSRNSTSDSSYARFFSGQLSVDDFSLALSAFESMSDVKIFSNPKIIVSNGKEAKVDMTTKFPNVRIQATRNTSSGSDSLDISTQLEVIPGEDKLLFAKEAFFSWGISLAVRPRISPDGLISVEITPQISQLDTSVVMDNNQIPNGFVQVKGGDSSAMSYYPIIDVKRLTTDFTMKDGSTAVIGGLSKTTEEDVDSGIPYLREIPWIGPKLFGWKSRGKVQKEIVVFVTVGIADPAELEKDVGLPKNAVLGREFVEGRQLEPGDRPNGAADATTLDMRPVDKRHQQTPAPVPTPAPAPVPERRGAVTITPVEASVAPVSPVQGLPRPILKPLPSVRPGAVDISPVA